MLYGSNGAAASNTPKNTILANIFPTNGTVNNASLFVNTTPSVAVKNMVVGLYGVTQSQVNVAHITYGKKAIAPGWVLLRSGMGPITSFNITANGTGYSNLDVVHATGNGCSNSAAVVTTNATGGIISLTNFANNGGLFPNTAFVTVSISNTTGGTANGTGFTGTVNLGGRAGRQHKEVLAVVPSMTSNSTYSPAAFPSS